MSSTLTWKPVKSHGALSDELKFVLRKRYGEPIKKIIIQRKNEEDYLLGLKDAGIKDADKLFHFLIKHGELELNEEC